MIKEAVIAKTRDALNFNLIERLAELIASELLITFPLKSVEVVVHKANAPVGLPVRDIAVRIKRAL